MVKRLSLFLAAFLFTAIGAMAQTQVSGTVVSQDDGEPIVGATVMVVGTNVGTATNVDGKFTLTCPKGHDLLRITYVGMEPIEVTARPNMRILLTSDKHALDEVVVVAYGTQRKTTLTGSIQEVKADKIDLRPTSSVASALEGTVTGVQVNSTYGQPGDDPSIRIRGIGTVNGSSSPLYILDGVPYGGNISDLNPQDIESMSVLKDAASAALYGNRASNGVILITTKKGRQGRLNVSLDIKQGTYSRGIPEYDRLDAREFMEAEWMILRNGQMAGGADAATAAAYATENLINERLWLNIWDGADNALFDANGKLLSNLQMKGTYGEDLDWFDQATRAGYRQEYNFNANGASDKADYLLSLGYLDENGYQYYSGFDRLSARVVANVQPKKWFKAGLNLAATHSNRQANYSDSNNAYKNLFMYARNIAPIYPVHLHDRVTGQYLLDANGDRQYDGGSYVDANGDVINTRNQYADRHIMWENDADDQKEVRNTVNGTAYADFILPYNFVFTLKGNLATRTNTENQYNTAQIGDGKGNNGRGKREEYRYKNYTFQQQLRWNGDFGVHSVDALIGHENYHYSYNYLYGYKTNQVFEGKNNLRNFTDITSLYDYDVDYATESYLGRVRYGYDDRYNFEASFRRDGSSRFHKDSRWGNFWSVGANWVISNEAFMKKYDWVNYLKLRADFGEVGNDAGSGYYGYMALYTATQNANKGAYYISQLPNEDLKWETGQSWGIGLDGRLWNRLNFSIEYFDKRNKDLLFDVYNPLSAGATSTSYGESVITKNIGTISNRGLEISADMDVFKNRDWRVNVGANITFLKNKVVKLPEQNKDGIISGSHKIVEGKDRYAWYTYTWEGINTKNGYSLYKFNDEDYYLTVDANGDPVTVTDNDGNLLPEFEDKAAVSGNNLQAIVFINGVPYSYLTTYAKREFHGTSIPKAYGSFNFSVSWRDLTLAALFTYQLGGKVMEDNYAGLMSAGGTPYALHKDVMKSWTYLQATTDDGIDPNGTPILANGLQLPNGNSLSLNATSSRWLTNASYLVMKNINLTYQLPKSIVNKLDLEGIGLTVACENLFTLTHLRGMNPQYSYSGGQGNYLVTPRVFSVGLNVRF